MKNNTIEAIKVIVNAMEEKKASDIRVLDISKISSIADYFVICTGSNSKQTQTIADEIEEKMSEYEKEIKSEDISIENIFDDVSLEGYNGGKWILLDYNGIVVHIFGEEERLFYNIDNVWKDADIVEVK